MLERENIDNFIADDLALRNRNWGQIEDKLDEKATVTELTDGLAEKADRGLEGMATLGKNLFNPNDIDILYNKTFDSAASITDSETFNITGFIKVNPDDKLIYSHDRFAYWVFSVWYDYGKNRISGRRDGSSFHEAQVEGAEWVRFAYPKSHDPQEIQIEKSETVTPFEKYGYTLNVSDIKNASSKIKNYDIYLRGKVKVVIGSTLMLNIEGTALYWLLPNGSYTFAHLESTYSLGQNEYIALNPNTKTILKKNITIDKTDINELVLALNVDNRIVLGVLKDFIVENQIVKNQATKILSPKYKHVDLDINGFQSLTVVGDELWVGFASDDDHVSWNAIKRYSMDDFSFIGDIAHQFGHLNGMDYNPENDCLMFGNGSSDATLPLKVYIIHNVSDWKNQTEVVWNTLPKTVIDLSTIENEFKAQAVWGDSNYGKHNVIYLITNDNQKVRKCLLGTGDLNYEYGDFVSGKSESEFNGTAKVIETYQQPVDYGVNGDTVFHGGKLLLGVGHDFLRACVFSVNADSTIDVDEIHLPKIKEDGSYSNSWAAGITVHENKVYQGYVGDESGILIYPHTF